ncbi:Iron-regulated virulence regulatory protein IrgB [Salinisphaera shabanensis E1L3A]|uniref:Iron-regulated virulence regulatory protein IrgB n=1 Tax=Salinisphaera shabanensis E1L3A TaxID=1033802 RepID=U2EQY5_9GAMM|nr:LysR family transcriptional regulator [Salinisphaera shabanensis]ERJ20457.1 Iron-regulated virulence regulatory protein IrgB [Salinisphaera shabanensis E1L3A]
MHRLSELAAFVAVVESASLTATARQMSLSKSTLSRRLTRLEARVGQPLLRRRSYGLEPTDAGQVFAGYCRDMLDIDRESRYALEQLSERVVGQLTVHAHPLFMRGWFMHNVEAFLARFTEIELNLVTLTQPPTGGSGVSLCLWPGELGDCGLRSEVVGYLTRGIYAHPDYLAERGTPTHPRELADHQWVDMLGERRVPLELRNDRQRLVYRLAPLRLRARTDQLVLQADAIARRGGLGVLPDWTAAKRSHAHPGTLCRCLPDWSLPALPVTLAYPYGRLPRKTVCLLDYLREAIPQAWRI